MKKALEKAGKTVRFVELEDSTHSFRADGQEQKEFEEILAFLAEHLPAEKHLESH